MTSFPSAVITWSKVHGKIEQGRAVLKGGQLSLLNSQNKDSGLYKCMASNQLGQASAVTHLSVVQLPKFSVRPPSDLDILKHRNVSVSCQAKSDPKPKVTWVRENSELPFGRSKVDEDGTLHIWNTKQEDSGKFTCVASSAGIFKAFSAMQLSVSCKWLNSKVGLKVFMKFCEPFAFTLVSYRLCNKLHKDRAPILLSYAVTKGSIPCDSFLFI